MSKAKTTLVITSIADDQNPVLAQYAQQCWQRDISFIVVGDKKSPAHFLLPHCEFLDLDRQHMMPFELAQKLPTGCYSRKNLGYLKAMQDGCGIIVETDDDNVPRANFWSEKSEMARGEYFEGAGWLNVYAHFTETAVWPRGFPLEHVLRPANLTNGQVTAGPCYCPIQQGLADGNPDVDAVYRLTRQLPVIFEKPASVILGRNSWSPFNSQNTCWFKPAFPLLYLPSHCSFRVTDIWRSFVAQRIAWECGWSIWFHGPTVWQDRNDHDLMQDFADEVVGYCNTTRIASALEALPMQPGQQAIPENLMRAYEKLVAMQVVGEDELPLLRAWINDLQELNGGH